MKSNQWGELACWYWSLKDKLANCSILDWHTASLPQNFIGKCQKHFDLNGEHSLLTQALLGSSRDVSPHLVGRGLA